MQTVQWTVEDASTSNPLNNAGVFEFDVDFVIEPGEPRVMYDSDLAGHPGSQACAIVSAVCCTQFSLAGRSPRKPTKKENEKLQLWFFDWLEQNPAKDNVLCAQGLEANDPENYTPDWGLEIEDQERLDDYF